MAKRKKRTPKPAPQRRRSKNSPVKWPQIFLNVVPYALAITVIGFFLAVSTTHAFKGDLFLLKQLSVKGAGGEVPDPYAFSGLQYREPLLSISLKEVEERIKTYHPEFSSVAVDRILPDTVEIHVKRHLAAARILIGKSEYVISSHGVVLPSDYIQKEIPLIIGLPEIKEKIVPGVKIHYPILDQAALLAAEMISDDVFGNHRLNYLDISDVKNFKLKIDDGIEVRLGSRNLTEKTKKLKNAILSLGDEIDPSKIRYIDLRFEDYVIGPR